MPLFMPTCSGRDPELCLHLLLRRLRISPDGSRGLAERPQKGTTHSFPVSKTCFLRHHVDRMCALLQHKPCRLDPKIFNCLRRLLAGLRWEATPKLPRPQPTTYSTLRSHVPSHL